MTSSNTTKNAGFTLIEVVLTITLIAILYTFTVGIVGTTDDAVRYDQTRQRMEALRIAIYGQDNSTDSEGARRNFGYFGDVGTLPSTLTDLVTKPGAMATWVFNSLYGIGTGWRGPYLAATALTGAKAFDRDGWGRQFTYTVAGMPSITSLGSDNAAGGLVYASDLVVQLSNASRLSTVSGIMEDYNARMAGATLEMAYPSAGALTLYPTTTLANGQFTFNSIPFGVRAIRVLTPNVSAARQIVVDRPGVVVPSSLLNSFGRTEAVSYVAASHFRTGVGLNVFASLASTYTTNVQLDAITVTWVGGGTVSTVIVNGSSETFAGVASGVRIDLSSDMILPAGTGVNSIELRFSVAPTGASSMTLLLEWLQRTRTDSVTFTIV